MMADENCRAFGEPRKDSGLTQTPYKSNFNSVDRVDLLVTRARRTGTGILPIAERGA